MRILVGADAPPNPDSGAAGTVVATNLALRTLGHEVEAFWDVDLAHRIRHWNLHYWLELPREYRREVARRCSGKDYDVIQLSQPHAWMAARDHQRRRRRGIIVNRSHGLECMADHALARGHRELGMPANRFPRNLLAPALQRRLHASIDRVVRFSDGLIVPAQDIKDHLVAHHGADPERVAVIHHGVPEAFLRTPVRPMSVERLSRMLCVAQYSFIKGPQFLARAASQVLRCNSRASLTWVCSRVHHAEARSLFPSELQPRVTLLDWQAQDELIALYDSHGIGLAHSLYEGAAKACAEAMARGLILVSSAVGAVKDHVRQGENGYRVDVGDSAGMADMILAAMGDLPAAEQISSAARLTAVKLTWEDCARRAVDFYRSLLDRKGSGQ